MRQVIATAAIVISCASVGQAPAESVGRATGAASAERLGETFLVDTVSCDVQPAFLRPAGDWYHVVLNDFESDLNELPRWRVPQRPGIFRPVFVTPRLLADCTTVVVVSASTVHILDTITGTWSTRDFDGVDDGFPTADGNVLGFRFDGEVVSAVDMDTGATLWQIPRLGAVDVVVSNDARVVALRLGPERIAIYDRDLRLVVLQLADAELVEVAPRGEHVIIDGRLLSVDGTPVGLSGPSHTAAGFRSDTVVFTCTAGGTFLQPIGGDARMVQPYPDVDPVSGASPSRNACESMTDLTGT